MCCVLVPVTPHETSEKQLLLARNLLRDPTIWPRLVFMGPRTVLGYTPKRSTEFVRKAPLGTGWPTAFGPGGTPQIAPYTPRYPKRSHGVLGVGLEVRALVKHGNLLARRQSLLNPFALPSRLRFELGFRAGLKPCICQEDSTVFVAFDRERDIFWWTFVAGRCGRSMLTGQGRCADTPHTREDSLRCQLKEKANGSDRLELEELEKKCRERVSGGVSVGAGPTAPHAKWPIRLRFDREGGFKRAIVLNASVDGMPRISDQRRRNLCFCVSTSANGDAGGTGAAQ